MSIVAQQVEDSHGVATAASVSNTTFWRTTACFSVATLAFVAWMFTNPGGQTVADNLDDFGIGVVAFVAGFLCIWRSRRSTGRTRTAWRLLAASALSWGVAEFIYSVLALRETVSTPSVADFGYLAAVPLGLLGILLLASPEQNGHWTARALSDGVIVAGSLLIISWTTALGSAYDDSVGSLFGRSVDLAYPISDIVIAAVALSLLSNWRGAKRTTLLVVVASELCFAFGDSAYAYVTAKSDFTYPNAIDASYFAAFCLLGLAALWEHPEQDPITTRRAASRWQVIVPYLALITALAVEVASGLSHDHLQSLLVVVGLIVLIAIIGRQMLVLFSNVALNTRLESAIERLQEREERLLHYALHDPLTGLANRLVLDDRLEEALAEGRGGISPLGVLLVDLDHFKQINDTLGHSVGDLVLRATALRLRESVRDEDVIVRTGGDEFAVLIDDHSGFADVEQIAARVVETIAMPIAVDNRELIVHASVGIAMGRPDALTAEALLRDADVALYAAKSMGGNTHRLFDDAISKVFFERLELQTDLTAAISEQQFTILYQPVVDIRANRVVGVEALLRWDHPRRGRLAPSAFLAMAEESGLIVPIGNGVLADALSQVRQWRDGLPNADHLWVSVNVSARQLLADDLVRFVSEALESAGLPPAALHLELSESTLIDQSKGSLELFEATRALGVSLTIDDFGTGYSSLVRLHRMPIDTLKIDREFISGLDADAHATKMIEAVVALAQTLGLEMIAEGIETSAQLDRMVALGSGYAQGYLFCEPVSAEQFEQWWRGTQQSPSLPLRASIANP